MRNGTSNFESYPCVQLTMLDERLLERPLWGRHLVWWLASLGVILTAARSFVNEDPVAYDPERAMQEVRTLCHFQRTMVASV